MAFSREQRVQFKQDGYIKIHDAIEQETVAQARKAVEAQIEDSEQEGYESITSVDDNKPFQEIGDCLRELASELVGSTLTPKTYTIADNLEIKINHPDNLPYRDSVRYRMPGGHEDGYLSSNATEDEQTGVYDYHTVGATAYLTDVAPRGGGFAVFPGSHQIVADYFKDHALNSLGWQACPPAVSESGGWDYDRRLDDQLDAEAISGDSGTIVLWHMRLLHGVSINQDVSPRLALITRFTHEQGDSIKHDAVPNLWKYWEAIPKGEPSE